MLYHDTTPLGWLAFQAKRYFIITLAGCYDQIRYCCENTWKCGELNPSIAASPLLGTNNLELISEGVLGLSRG